jgi:Protein of unknown function (DUF2442)
MKQYKISAATMSTFPRLLLTFEDGVSGELDMTHYIERGPMFAALKDRSFFAKVAVARDGRSFGWKLDDYGHELDFGADAARADIETERVLKRAAIFRATRVHAAE